MTLSEELQKLWEVQLIDIEILYLKEELTHLNRGEELKKQLEALEKGYNQKLEEAKSKEITLKELEIELNSIEEKIKKDEERVYNMASTQKQIDSLNQEIDHLKKEKYKIEDKILETMESLELLRNELPLISERIEKTKTSLANVLDNASKLEKDLSRKLEEKESIRGEKIKYIDGQILTRYETLRKTRRGRGISKVTNGRCSECGVELSISLLEELKAKDKLLTCEHCGRILLFEE
ncbi:MAG: zinc ribbon domain-containing protein [bacterium]